MSGNSVDNRIVEMTFNNAEFERKMAETLKSLDKFKQSLDFSSSRRNVEDLQRSTDKFNLGGMANSVHDVSLKFLALSTIAVTTLATITKSAIDAGATIARALTIQPLLDGFREYETNINSIQTILANTSSKGTTLDDVTKALDILNEYSDQTIYNFGEMTRNIGTFTAAGVDLDTAVGAIKGIANVAAISGSNSQQASMAMYQLSQAIATGTVKLIDWNSVVNAGMGGEVFQKALFETGKAMGTLVDVPLSESFDEWKEKGNSFRASLESGWLTADVLTQTLNAFTGDLSEAQLVALGYTEEQARMLAELGRTGKAAATDVKTLTQLLSTVREAMGSGWSQSFRIIVGDFEQAKELFTGLSDVIGGFVQKNADARNKMLQQWSDFGGRNNVLEGFKAAFEGILSVLKPIRTAFREIFPPITFKTLLHLSNEFRLFAERLKIGGETARQVKEIFRGIFSALRIGWEVVKQGARFFTELFKKFSDAHGTGILEFFADLGNTVTDLKTKLVDEGGIEKFFDNLVIFAQRPIDFFMNLKENILGFVSDVKAALRAFFTGQDIDASGAAAPFEALRERFEGIQRIAETLYNLGQKIKGAWDWLWDFFAPVRDLFADTFNFILDWFKDLGQKLADGIDTGDFQPLLDVLNVGLLGAIAAFLGKFASEGIGVDLTGGLLKGFKGDFERITGSISRSFDQLTGTLSAMQAEIKAEAILKIAKAVALLTASVLVLSTIDSASLTKALTAMTVGFGQLIGSMLLLTKSGIGPGGAASFSIISAGMIALASAMLILALAVKVMSTMSWNELVKGLFGVTTLLGVLAVVTKPLAANSGGLISAGIAMSAIGVALNILALAVKSFAEMSWEEMAQGLLGVTAGLMGIVLAMRLMPTQGMIGAGLGILAISVALNVLALAVKSFAEMSWEEMGKGLAGVGAGLLIIAGAMNLMPGNMIFVGLGLLGVAVALNAIALAVKSFSDMSWEEMGKGMAGLASSLLILAGAMYLMSGTIGGAIALTIVSGALVILVNVLKKVADLSWSEILKGLGGLAAILLVLGVGAAAMSAVIGPLLALGAAMTLVGVAMALFGLGAIAVAKAFQIIAKAGKAGLEVLFALIDGLVERLPEIATSLGLALVDFATTFTEAAGPLIEAIGILFSHILETVREKFPEFVQTGVEMIHEFLGGVRDVIPDVVDTIIEVILAILTAIRDNIYQITSTAVEIITGFAQALIDNMPTLVATAVELIVAFLTELGNHAEELVTAGLTLLTDFLRGITENLAEVATAVGELIGEFILQVGNIAEDIVEAGFQAMEDFLEGMVDGLIGIGDTVAELITEFLEALNDQIDTVIQAGWDFIIDFIDGLTASLDENGPRLRTAIFNLGKEVAEQFGLGLALAVPALLLGPIAGFFSSIKGAFEGAKNTLGNAASAVGGFIGDGFGLGLSGKAKKLENIARAVVQGAIDAGKDQAGIKSPSTVMMEMGEYMVEGLAIGLSKNVGVATAAVDTIDAVVRDFANTLSSIKDIGDIAEFQPVITPVLDLSQVQAQAATMESLLGNPTVTAQLGAVSANEASDISAETEAAREQQTVVVASEQEPLSVTFEQNNYSPEPLSASRIYRFTKSQIELAKEELGVS